MGAPEVARFLTSLAVDARVAASTQNQALNALLFLYRVVLEQELPWLDDVVRAKQPQRLPVVLTREEVRAVLTVSMAAQSSSRSCSSGKGAKDRVTMLPGAARPGLLRVADRAGTA